VFVQIALTFGLLFWMGAARFEAVRRGEVKLSAIALGERAWPSRVTQISNSYHNQLELPVLFYAVVAFALIADQVSPTMVALAWLFVLARAVHVYIYTGSNVVPRRFQAYVAGALVLLLMWALLAVGVLWQGF
jgi:hypothetical protein